MMEKTSATYTAALEEVTGTKIALAVLDAITLQVYDDDTPSAVLRTAQDVLNTNDVTIVEGAAATTLTWTVRPGDSRLVDGSKDSEIHVAVFEWAWDTATSGTQVDPFTTTDTSSDITVNIPTHGLSTTSVEGENHVFLIPTTTAGGRMLAGRFIIKSVTDADNFVITADCAATSTAAAVGGSTAWFLGGKHNSHKVLIPIIATEPACV